jgi:hypothetical protein
LTQVLLTREIPADVYERELPTLVRYFEDRARQGSPLHTGRLPGNFMLIANIRQEKTGGVIRACVVEPDLRPKEHGRSAQWPDWPVLVRIVPGAEAKLDCQCSLKAAGGRCYHRGILEALHPDLGNMHVYGSEDGLARSAGMSRKPTFKDLNGTASLALKSKIREPGGDKIDGHLNFYVFHSGSTGTLVVERRRAGEGGGSTAEWACSKCPLGKTDLKGRCAHSYRQAGLRTFVPQGDGVDEPSTPEEVWGQDLRVKPYPKLGTAMAVVCTGCPPGYRNQEENVSQTRASPCRHLPATPSTLTRAECSAEQLRERPIRYGTFLRVAHVCTTACELRPCGALPPRHDALDQTVERWSAAEVTQRSALGTFCQDRPAGAPPCGSEWRLEWTEQARLLRSSSLQAISLGTWKCHPPCASKCALKFDAAGLGLYFLTPEFLCTQLVLKVLEDALYKHQSLAEAAQSWDATARRTSSECTSPRGRPHPWHLLGSLECAHRQLALESRS